MPVFEALTQDFLYVVALALPIPSGLKYSLYVVWLLLRGHAGPASVRALSVSKDPLIYAILRA